MSSIQTIKIKRTASTLSDVSTLKLKYGEPLYVKGNNTTNSNDGGTYLVTGYSDDSGETVSRVQDCKVVKYQPQSFVDNALFYSTTATLSDNDIVVTLMNDKNETLQPLVHSSNVEYEYGEYPNITNIEQAVDALYDGSVPSYKANTVKATVAGNSKYFILGVPSTGTYKDVYYANNPSGTKNATGIYFDGSGVLMGAAWNDFAERRKCGIKTPGICVVESPDGVLKASRRYRLPAAYIISDTYGMVIGEEDEKSVPIAVAGRVLAFVENKDKIKVGDALKTAPGGKLAKMNRLEVFLFPDRVVGHVSEIPSYEEWNGVEVNGRIWVKL